MRLQGPVQRTRVNHLIRITPIRLIGADGEQVGVVETGDALRMAGEAGLDLVEISPEARPPVCKIMDYGKYKYELSKKENKGKSGKAAELKEIRLGRSIKIGKHDVQIRVDQARRFLIAGHKVQITQRFRGREMAHKRLGEDRLRQICLDLDDVAKVEMSPRSAGRQMSILLAPDRPKIEVVVRQMAEEDRIRAKDLAALEAEVAAQNAAIALLEDKEDQDDDKKDKKSKGKKDNRIQNPVEDEVADMLGE